MGLSPKITIDHLGNILNVSGKTVYRDIARLTAQGLVSREGGDNGGRWIVKVND